MSNDILQEQGTRSTARDWWRELKQFCGTSKAARRDFRSILRTNTESCDQELANELMKAFVSVLADYTPLSKDVWVLTDHGESIVVDEESKKETKKTTSADKYIKSGSS